MGGKKKVVESVQPEQLEVQNLIPLEMDTKTEGFVAGVLPMLEPAVMQPYFDPTVLYCTCRKPETEEMIGCDTCDNWYHASCVNLDFAKVLPIIDSFPFICPECVKKAAAK